MHSLDNGAQALRFTIYHIVPAAIHYFPLPQIKHAARNVTSMFSYTELAARYWSKLANITISRKCRDRLQPQGSH